MHKKIFAFVFARGGSKGLPGKNLKMLGDKPLIAHSIKLALSMPEIDGVFVSTDDPQISKVAKSYGANVINRPANLASDTASELEAWKHAINQVIQDGNSFDLFLSLPATSPLRNLSDIRRSLAALDDATDIVVTVTPASRNPYFNMLTRDENGWSRIFDNNSEIKRRQDAPQVFDITTVAYVTRPNYILQTQGILNDRVKSVIIPKERAVDIDDVWDYEYAKAVYRMTNDVEK